MISDKEAVEAFEVLHDYCDERVCEKCLFFDEERTNSSSCLLRNYNIAYLRIEEVPSAVYKVRKGVTL